MDSINSIVKGKKYNSVMDLFMGSGHVLFNIDVQADCYIGNDKIKLLPLIYSDLWNNNYKFTLQDIEDILNQHNRFSTKESYYTFRDYWNDKYLKDKIDKQFIIETILLLKMCSNSMVRFNPKEGYFNQGFRGLGKKTEFFTDTMKNLCINEINKLSDSIQEERFEFRNIDFLNYIDEGNDHLLILDPPYILRKDMYDTDWTENHDKKLFDIMSNTKNDFIYFNYIERDGVINQELVDFINKNNLHTININNKTLAGQGRSENILDVKEVIVTNVQM
jgi:hypothetical protein